MANATPYEILGVTRNIKYGELRRIYRAKIHEYREEKINPINFQRICRAYETLSDYNKRRQYDLHKKWIAEVPVNRYTLQQLAAEPDLIHYLKNRLEDARIGMINAQDSVTGHTALYCAARVGNVEGVKILTERGAESDLSQRTKSTALHVASFYGHADVVRYLLESGADYRIANAEDSIAEQEAFGDDVKRVFVELKESPYVRVAADELDWFHENGLLQHQDTEYFAQRQTLLHCASKKGYFAMVCWLVEDRLANIDLVDFNGNSPLHLAIYGGHFKLVDYLLNRGCNPKFRNRWGTTAEEEGVKHGRWIADLFRSMNARDMFEMAREGVFWWFDYYFDEKRINTVDSNGVSLLYHACRYGRYPVAKWLLEHGANKNVQLTSESKSTPLHGAKYHGHVSIVELLLRYGADVNIKNNFGATVFDEAVDQKVDRSASSQIHKLLSEYQHNLRSHKLIDVEIYLHERDTTIHTADGVEEEPVIKLQIDHKSVCDELYRALAGSVWNEQCYFSIAGRPLNFPVGDKRIMSAVYRARYTNSKLVDTPLRLTLHQTALTDTDQRDARENIILEHRRMISLYEIEKIIGSFVLKFPFSNQRTFKCGDLIFTFSANCITDDITFEVTKLKPTHIPENVLPNAVCFFKTALANGANHDALLVLPLVTITRPANARLYTLAMPSTYWFSSDTRSSQLPILGGVHTFVSHVDIIPKLLTLPSDIFIAQTLKQPLRSRDQPVPCKCLTLREHNTGTFPHIAYHGTNINVIRSILLDGLVPPGTIVSSGKRINPPPGHIARELAFHDIHDFATGIFLSPSIHYSSDSVYAKVFTHGDQQLIPVLECSIKRNSFVTIECTTIGYVAHPGDDLTTIEWRVTDPMCIEINAILFITKINSISANTAARRATITAK